MAIIPEFDGLTVIVKIDGKTATEYPVPEDFDQLPEEESAKQPICCFIESASGLSFSVKASTNSAFKAPPPFDHLTLQVWVDGNHVLGNFQLLSEGPVKLKIDRCDQTSTIPGCVESRRLIFSSVSGVDGATESTIDRDVRVASKIGTIKAELSLAYGGTKVENHGSGYQIPRSDTALQLAEKSMKGRELTHGATLSTDFKIKTSVQHVAFSQMRRVATLLFFYRSRSALRKEMVLPPSPSPPPASVSVKLEDKKTRRSSLVSDLPWTILQDIHQT
ncbi:hypothetical protein L249_7147 [Ophiocordyceps polyrhachis-furcata BCC 54312]|uniref:DUF7918 domain-containing protein n=1 Tax=Ophiocordyceps polyrhachis-furcata BCC 54312 TaxID=1330021 RepID=A0A367LBI7_9HYPO|nr:hypothetical protein L249_7147 [Ophiocordyceps polyrhachis-furcata BCC 54312]